MSAPLRFFGLVIGGWTAARIAALMWTGAPSAAVPVSLARKPAAPVTAVPADAVAPQVAAAPSVLPSGQAAESVTASPDPVVRPARLALLHPRSVAGAKTRFTVSAIPPPTAGSALTNGLTIAPVTTTSARFAPLAAASSLARGVGRLSASAWMLARSGGGDDALAAGNGLLGGSQAGARFLYRVSDNVATPVSLSARVSSPLRRSGAEAAFGVEWQPVAGLPVRLLAERRERVSGEGRSAFALLAHGGVGDRAIAAGFTLDAYAQAGVVGAHRRDLFADGGATLVRPVVGPIALGAGAWGGAQPGAERLDVGPRATAILGSGNMRVRASLDWRFRVAGSAAPASGPSLTIGTDF